MWAAELREILTRQPCVVVTVADIAGSAPRAVGSRMLVTADGTRGSIGGGNLEYRATETARQLLAGADPEGQHLELFGLGPELNQCCGGAVTLTYEVFARTAPGWLEPMAAAGAAHEAAVLVSAIDAPASRKWLLEAAAAPSPDLPAAVTAALPAFFETPGSAARVVEDGRERYLVEPVRRPLLPLYLFGAGHVGRALAAALAPLPFEVTWLDSRPGQLPAAGRAHLTALECADPAARVADCPPGGSYVVMTHSHQLDEDICHAVLQRADAAWLGLIGSATKRRRFVHRLAARGVPGDALERLVCPIGLAGITGKRPATIAVAVAAQLLREIVPESLR
jgi:xanthine dehydrogenase accessory factor